MNEAFEKILNKLDKQKQLHERLISYEHKNGTITEEYQHRKAIEILDKSKDIVHEVAEEYNNGWIPCSERLPEEKNGEVLICDEKGEVGTGRYSEYSETWYKGDMRSVGVADVIAWQPLPEPFNDNKNE